MDAAAGIRGEAQRELPTSVVVVSVGLVLVSSGFEVTHRLRFSLVRALLAAFLGELEVKPLLPRAGPARLGYIRASRRPSSHERVSLSELLVHNITELRMPLSTLDKPRDGLLRLLPAPTGSDFERGGLRPVERIYYSSRNLYDGRLH